MNVSFVRVENAAWDMPGLFSLEHSIIHLRKTSLGVFASFRANADQLRFERPTVGPGTPRPRQGRETAESAKKNTAIVGKVLFLLEKQNF